jgi:hypothetical protein
VAGKLYPVDLCASGGGSNGDNLDLFDEAMPAPAIESDDDKPLKSRSAPAATSALPTESASSSAIKEFQKGWWLLRDSLAHIETPDLLELLSCNGLRTPGVRPSRDTALAAAANVMFVGVPPPCPICQCSLRIENLQWKCSGRISEWTECAGPTEAILCSKPQLPENFGGSGFKFKFVAHPLPVFHMAAVTELASPPSIRSPVALPLAGATFYIEGKFARTHAKIVADIRQLGGSVCKSALGGDLTHILTDTVSVGAGDVADVLGRTGGGVVAVDEGWLERVAAKMIAEYDNGVIGGTPPSFNPKFASSAAERLMKWRRR